MSYQVSYLATENGSGRGRQLPRASKHLRFGMKCIFLTESAVLGLISCAFYKMFLAGKKEGCFSAPWSVGGSGCPFFLFYWDLDSRYVSPQI